MRWDDARNYRAYRSAITGVHMGGFKFSLHRTLYTCSPNRICEKDYTSQKMLIYDDLYVNYKFTSAGSGQDFSLLASWTPVNLM